ncbi:single-stranded DNA-binding protein, partial [Listeria monocytogenes]
ADAIDTFQDEGDSRAVAIDYEVYTDQFLEPKNNPGRAATNDYQNKANYSNNIQTSSYAAGASQKGGAFVSDSKPIDISDDDLPF